MCYINHMTILKDEISVIQSKYHAIKDCLSEKGKRLWAAVEVRAYGRGGVTLVCKATGISTATVCKGVKELKAGKAPDGRIRQQGGVESRLKSSSLVCLPN